ncbi:biliverdin-producing heme oxygenase [Gillisia sp. CAL575]|uniref:biliverdin-producing heme oxygenase n=1 Tax=Gillisia sp. CAL575 TaxID=985255 RepID=UPI00039CA09F|nr:biliverdin-producing heme oxygenase [Gillisia sp. CAL575]
MINSLREHTKSLHQEIEKDNLAGLIMDHSISLAEYKTLLLQNYISYKLVENAVIPYLKDFGSIKSDQLEKDLNALDVNLNVVERFKNGISCSNKVEALGAAYVVEGSVLGGLMIAKELKNCKNLEDIKEHRFFNGDRNNISGWKTFLKKINSEDFSEEEKLQASNKAKDTFMFFGKVFSEVRSSKIESNSVL